MSPEIQGCSTRFMVALSAMANPMATPKTLAMA
jgi:hypothetical protein